MHNPWSQMILWQRPGARGGGGLEGVTGGKGGTCIILSTIKIKNK